MSLQLQSRAATHGNGAAVPTNLCEVDLDAVDAALDRGDLDAVRALLGLTPDAWRLVLARL